MPGDTSASSSGISTLISRVSLLSIMPQQTLCRRNYEDMLGLSNKNLVSISSVATSYARLCDQSGLEVSVALDLLGHYASDDDDDEDDDGGDDDFGV